jgi:hypothetical protein
MEAKEIVEHQAYYTTEQIRWWCEYNVAHHMMGAWLVII